MSTSSVIDHQELMNRLDGDMELLGELLEIFQEDYPSFCEQMEQALNQGNAEQVRQIAHTLKGSVGNFAAPRAFQLAYELEMMGKENRLGDAFSHWQKLQDAIQEALEELSHLTRQAVE